jgi:Wzt C-terminal domain
MILNGFPVDPDRLKILILSAPRTGNTWLRWLLNQAYWIPMIELPLEWAPGCADDLPPRFVAHQHFPPSESLVRWLVESRAFVLTMIRHPADTFLSYFHYVKWHDTGSDLSLQSPFIGNESWRSAAMLKQDGDRPGKNALRYINYCFPQIYANSLAWAKLGSHVVRYEDLLADPLSQLREVTSKIVPQDEERLKAAVFLCKPEQLTGPGLIDPRHLRTRSARRWIQELPSEIVDAMAGLQPYASACKMYGYDWSRSPLEPLGYDYDKIDPFRGRDRFDNGELIGPSLAKIYLHGVPNASARWPDPWVTEGESFWNWLRAPSALASLNPDLPTGTLTNLMVALHNQRPDLQLAYRNPSGSDRMGFLTWFLGLAELECEIPWGLIGPVLESFCDYLNSQSGDPFFRQPPGKITQLTVLDAHGAKTNSFRCADCMQIELEFQLDEPVDGPLIQYSLCNAKGEVVFGTNSELLGNTLPRLAPGCYVCRIISTLSIPPQNCLVYVGLACLNSADSLVPIHTMHCQEGITVIGGDSQGTAWCSTRIAMTRRSDP